MSKLIAITGGIGSGKSIVSKILIANGYTVYDCDYEAKRIMDIDTNIHSLLTQHIHSEAVKDGIIDRKLIASIVFNDNLKLEKLNSIVHQAVRDDIRKCLNRNTSCNIMFVETAILYQSNIDLMVNEVWTVTAPHDIRIKRVMRRNNCSWEDVDARINAQDNYTPLRVHPRVKEIINDDLIPVLPQVIRLLEAATMS